MSRSSNVYSVRESAEALGIGKDICSRALGELQDRGFIKPTKLGAFSTKVRHATQWALTAHPSEGAPSD